MAHSSQIDDLRFTIPRVVQPLNNTQIKDNPAFFSVYKQVVTACQNDFHSFRTNWMSEEFQKILEHSKESLKANSDLSASVQVPEYGWIRRESAEAEAARRRKDHGPKSDDSATTLDKESISGILDDFQKAHPQIKVEAKDDNRDLLVLTTIPKMSSEYLQTGRYKLRQAASSLNFISSSVKRQTAATNLVQNVWAQRNLSRQSPTAYRHDHGQTI